ncbi:hypothetical protein [Streptomyces sp. Ag109_O5-10]|uniref:hypothetical protein n=1 Tax=Streptomyces sp. Ag109_O5-10 TaxID=1855349 RepID=UPI000B8193F8|nr:hypothetical protein [Streptomyces sp. Ag109_O5-10]
MTSATTSGGGKRAPAPSASGTTPPRVRPQAGGNDEYRSGIASGAEVVKGSGRLDTTPYSGDIG